MSSKVKNIVAIFILIILVILFILGLLVGGKKDNYLYINKTKTVNDVEVNYPYFNNHTINNNINNYLKDIDSSKYDMVDYNIYYSDTYISVLFSKYKNKKIVGYDSYIFDYKGNIVSIDNIISDHASLIENIKSYTEKNSIDINGYDINSPICYLLDDELGVILRRNDDDIIDFKSFTILYSYLSTFNNESPKITTTNEETTTTTTTTTEVKVTYDKVVAFTFDDGPSKYTLDIMDILDKYDSKATFFEVGYMIRNNKSIVKEVINRGFEVGNHTTDHSNLCKLSLSEVQSKISDNNTLFYEITGKNMTFLRPPYGNFNDNVKKSVDVPIIKWSVDSRDWESRNRDKIVAVVKANIKDGDIVLFHDLYSTTRDAIEVLVPDLISDGYKIVSVSELFSLKNMTLEPQKVYSKAR